MATGRLPDHVKEAVVTALACFDTPKQVRSAIQAEYGLDLSPQQIEAYDPNKSTGRNLSERLRKMFERTRRKFHEDLSDIPISNKAYRLRALARMYAQAESRGNLAMAASLLEQAAKECGDVFTNKQKIDGKVHVAARTVIVPAKGSC